MPISGIRCDEKISFVDYEEIRQIVRQEMDSVLDRFVKNTNNCSEGELADSAAVEALFNASLQTTSEQVHPLRDQDGLEEVNKVLSNLSPGMEKVLKSCFDVSSLLSFLVQCGQFSRINQCWTVCFQAIEKGSQLDDASETLKFLLHLHNRGANTLQAGLVEPGENTPYDFEISQRFDSDGSRVKELVLPGLRNAGGKLVVKALVRLH